MSALLRLPVNLALPFLTATLLAGLGGCVIGPRSSAAPATPEAAERATDSAPVPGGAAAVRMISGEELERAAVQSASLTDLLRGRIGSLQIQRGSQAGACPRLTLRGIKSIALDSSPDIYLDGARVSDGCILETLVPTQVRAVVVYPGGLSPDGAGYAPSPNGLILVFTHD